MRWRWYLPALVAACALPAGCREDVLAVEDEANAVRVEATDAHLVVTNGRHERIWYLVMNAESSPLIEWVPCTASACPSIAPQAIVRVPYTTVVGGAGDVILFHWWTALTEEGNRPGPVHTLRVER